MDNLSLEVWIIYNTHCGSKTIGGMKSCYMGKDLAKTIKAG